MVVDLRHLLLPVALFLTFAHTKKEFLAVPLEVFLKICHKNAKLIKCAFNFTVFTRQMDVDLRHLLLPVVLLLLLLLIKKNFWQSP